MTREAGCEPPGRMGGEVGPTDEGGASDQVAATYDTAGIVEQVVGEGAGRAVAVAGLELCETGDDVVKDLGVGRRRLAHFAVEGGRGVIQQVVPEAGASR